MDQALLVKSDRIIEAQVLDAVDRAGGRPPIALCDWNYVEQLQEWQLIIATSWIDSKGPRATYAALVAALEKAGVYQHVPMRRVFLKSPSDPLVKMLLREASTGWEGFIHLLRHHGNGKPGKYALVFAPITRDGAAPVRRFSSLDELTATLTDDLHLFPPAVKSALDEMKRTGAGSIYPVLLTTRQLKKFGLS